MSINGTKTLEEASQYFDALDFRVKQLALAMVTVTDSALQADWAGFKSRWDVMALKVRLRMGAMIASNPLLLLSSGARSVFPDPLDYQAIQDAWSPTYPLYTDADGAGIQKRLEAQGKVVNLDNQPKQNSLDVDLKLYQASDSAIKKGEQTTSNFVQDNWGKGLLLGALGLGAAIVYKKV